MWRELFHRAVRNGQTLTLPDWFETLNRDFRYQLTCIGGFAPVYVAQKVTGNQFRIAGGTPGLEVSWQVTGIRQDKWAEAHRIPVEQDKREEDKGKYLHPELFGEPAELRIGPQRPKESVRANEPLAPVTTHPSPARLSSRPKPLTPHSPSIAQPQGDDQ